MKSEIRRAFTAFSIAALGAFALVQGQTAQAAIYTVPGRTCVVSGGGTVCGIMNGSAIGGTASRAYFDFKTTGANNLISAEFYRQTFNGTISSRSKQETLNAGFHELSVDVTPMNANASAWDYLFAAVVGPPGSGVTTLTNIMGIALFTS